MIVVKYYCLTGRSIQWPDASERVYFVQFHDFETEDAMLSQVAYGNNIGSTDKPALLTVTRELPKMYIERPFGPMRHQTIAVNTPLGLLHVSHNVSLTFVTADPVPITM
jgi:hypothetical protein